jgi:DNA-3-methyladenine glycosylase
VSARAGDAAATNEERSCPGLLAAHGIRRLHREELPVDTTALARFLIGKTLVHELAEGITSGRIVETEAYVVGDAAAHAFRGRTARNRTLFLERGHAYVYFIYGCWYSINVSGELPGVGAGALLRAIEPLQGIALMQRRRGVERALDLARGPGRLAAAMQIDRSLDGTDLCAPGPFWLGDAERPVGEIGRSVRIGIKREAGRLLRFYERGNPFVSGLKRLSP